MNKVIVIVGPTASGKTDLGISLAKKFNGEIISADSRLIYKELNIGTAKPIKDDKKDYTVQGIPHHMIDICPPSNSFNAALFKERAVPITNEIIQRGSLPFLVGGTGLYLDAVTMNLNFPQIEPNITLRNELELQDVDNLYTLYQEIDPIGAQEIDKKNKRRLIRAIEVCKITGKPFWQNRTKNPPLFQFLQIGISIEKEILLKRIEKRTDFMIQNGLQQEALFLIEKYGNIPPLNTIGYQEWREYINQEISPSELLVIRDRIILNTFKFAKRQITWFKKNYNIRWIEKEEQATLLLDEFLSK